MRMFMKTVLVLSGLLLVGCGGGGTPESNVGDTKEGMTVDNTQAYQNNKLPTIGNDTIPEVLLKSSGILLKKIKKQYKEATEQSSNFSYLKERARFFYQKQLEMNVDLSYFDSVWSQVEEYCQNQNICSIPDGQIVFTYTRSLYLHDLELIKNYEDKTDDLDRYRYYAQDMERLVGQNSTLTGVELTVNPDAEYNYKLLIQNVNIDDMREYHEKSIVKWNEDKSKYLYRDEVVTSEDNINYDQFQYFESAEEKTSKYMSNNSGYYDESLEFVEKDDMITFIEDEPSEDEMTSFYAKGFLNDVGGEMTISGAGDTYYERFDSNGNLISVARCVGNIHEINETTNEDYCFINDNARIQNFLVKKRYFLLTNFDISVVLLPEDGSQSYVDFLSDNTLRAVVDCYRIHASYIVNSGGVSFFNVNKVKDDTLHCYNSTIENIFVDFLNTGIDWSDGSDPGYNPVYDLDYYGLGQL